MEISVHQAQSITLTPDWVALGSRRPATQATVKRLIDLVLSLLALVASVPIFLAVAVAIKLDSPGPVFHIGDRVGRYGRHFRFIKFRSMRVDAEQRLQVLAALNEADGPVFKMRSDPRVTRVGRFIRRTSLDELPQLINVLSGDMSLVGPRPPLPREVETYGPMELVRLSVKPGITCLWQINGRSNCSFARWMEYDREYIQRFSIWLDLAILLRTAWTVLTCRGAY
jgi:exopolysaccharide biosynthesis polyprenyl glycosylphosphotransferase